MLAASAAAALTLLGLDGGTVTVNPAAAPATVMVFVSTVCPVSNDYSARLSGLFTGFKDRGVNFYFVYSNQTESDESVRAHVGGLAMPFPAYRDQANQVADRFEARLTPSAFVMARDGSVIYRGAIDDAVNPARVKSHYLRDAILAALAGRPPAVSAHPVYG